MKYTSFAIVAALFSHIAHKQLVVNAVCISAAPPEARDPFYGLFGRRDPAAASATARQALVHVSHQTRDCESVRVFRGNHSGHAQFWMPRDDYGAHVMNNGWFSGKEHGYGDVFDWILRHDAAPPSNSLIVDVGSNAGWYSMFAISRGYSVVAFDMQPECNRRSRCAAEMMRASDRYELHTCYVTDDESAGPLVSQSELCIGALNTAWRELFEWSGATQMVPPLHLGKFLAQRLGLTTVSNIDSRHSLIPDDEAHAATTSRGTGRISAGLRIPLIKVDIEGGEVAVARSLAAAGSELLRRIDHMVIEYSSHMWPELNITTAAGVAAFAPLFAAGFVAVDLPEGYLVRPQLWMAHPLTGPGIIREAGTLAAYTQQLLRQHDQDGSVIYTLWFYRPQLEQAGILTAEA